MFFALASSIYRNYRLESEIGEFQEKVDALYALAEERPAYLDYVLSDEYKDLHAKETENLINPGEKMIIVPTSEENVEKGPADLMTDELSPESIINQPNSTQWWEYFFGDTLSFKAPKIDEEGLTEQVDEVDENEGIEPEIAPDTSEEPNAETPEAEQPE